LHLSLQRLLRQLLQNLLSNAVKFTPADGRVTLVVSSRPEGGAAIEIADTGIGIAADKVAQLFQPFTQGDASLSRQYSGTGLGLALVDRIARLHGATVAVRSAPGRGSTFTLELSAEPAAPAKFS
jgi:signal transduction histidine kinase